MSPQPRRAQESVTVRTTLDLPREVNRALRKMAIERGSTLQSMLGALAAALAADDARAVAIVKRAEREAARAKAR